MTCGSDGSLSACTSDDVVVGLWQVSQQLQGLSAYLLVVGVLVVIVLYVIAALAWWRR